MGRKNEGYWKPQVGRRCAVLIKKSPVQGAVYAEGRICEAVNSDETVLVVLTGEKNPRVFPLSKVFSTKVLKRREKARDERERADQKTRRGPVPDEMTSGSLRSRTHHLRETKGPKRQLPGGAPGLGKRG